MDIFELKEKRFLNCLCWLRQFWPGTWLQVLFSLWLAKQGWSACSISIPVFSLKQEGFPLAVGWVVFSTRQAAFWFLYLCIIMGSENTPQNTASLKCYFRYFQTRFKIFFILAWFLNRNDTSSWTNYCIFFWCG